MAEVKVLGINNSTYIVVLYVSIGGVIFEAPGIQPTFKECASIWGSIWFTTIHGCIPTELIKADPLMEQWILKRGWMLVSPCTKSWINDGGKKCIVIPLTEGGDLE